MERFINAIKNSLKHENWYAALFLALTIPDICGNLSSTDKSEGSRVKYERWFNQYLAQKYKARVGPNHIEHVFLSASDCYALRCALLHSAMDDITEQRVKQTLSKVSFSALRSHCNQINDVLCLNVIRFCEDIIDATEKWNKDITHNAEITEKLKYMIVIHEEPYSPLPGVGIR